MVVTLSTDLRKQLERELASGRYSHTDELIEQAIREFLDECERARRRRQENPADLYEQVLSPDLE